jgi:two-component system NtrC family sensor kinase
MLRERKQSWFWATLLLSSVSIVALVFAFWELVENRFFRDLDYLSLHYLYISRGIASAVLLATWAAWFVLRDRRIAERELRQSHERYRGLLDSSPGAVALYDPELRVLEWNASAERLYEFTKPEVLNRLLPTVPDARQAELREFLEKVKSGAAVLDQETRRRRKSGEEIEVQLSLLPFQEQGSLYFLEVTADIRERVRLRERLLELEKLTAMGEMAAGTAHHLNTPLASMLLRVQMMREREGHGQTLQPDLVRLEQTIGFCQQFVRRLLDFSRRPAFAPEPEQVGEIVSAVLGFIAPVCAEKKAHIHWQPNGSAKAVILADRNQMETLLLILLRNSLDAIKRDGNIGIGLHVEGDRIEIGIKDDGCGISATDRARLFEPFFTTKPPGKGTGLGLAIAKTIVEQHEGEIVLESMERGTLARVFLPIHGARRAGGRA